MHDSPKWLRIADVLVSWLRVLYKPKARSILAVCIGAYGDGFLFTGFLRELSRRFPGFIIRVACTDRVHSVLKRELAGFDLICIDTGQDQRGLLGGFRRVFQGLDILMPSYCKAVNLSLRASRLSHEIIRVARASQKVWFEDGKGSAQDEAVADVEAIYTELAQCAGATHVLDKMAVLLSSLIDDGDGVDRSLVLPSFTITRTEEEQAKEYLGSLLNENKPVIVICHGAHFRRKDWGEDKYAELIIELFRSSGARCVLIGGAEDKDRAFRIAQTAQKAGVIVTDLTGRTTLGEAVAVISIADLCVGNDTFGLHVTQAIGTPSLVLMWGGDFGPWNPWGDKNRHRLLTQPCEFPECNGACKFEEWKCVRDIPLKAVVTEVKDMLKVFC